VTTEVKQAQVFKIRYPPMEIERTKVVTAAATSAGHRVVMIRWWETIYAPTANDGFWLVIEGRAKFTARGDRKCGVDEKLEGVCSVSSGASPRFTGEALRGRPAANPCASQRHRTASRKVSASRVSRAKDFARTSSGRAPRLRHHCSNMQRCARERWQDVAEQPRYCIGA